MKQSAAFDQRSEVGRILNAWRQLHRNDSGPERFDQTRGCLLACRVGVQHRIQALPLAEQLQRGRAATGPAQGQARHAPLLQRQQIERTLDDGDAASVATGVIPAQERLGTRKPKVTRQVLCPIQQPTDEPHGLMLTEFREDDSACESFAAIGAQQANASCSRHGYISPGQVGHEFVAGGEADVLPYEHVSRKAARSEIAERSSVAEQPIGIKLDGGGKRADLVLASSWRVATGRTTAANNARFRFRGTRVQPICGVSERELLDLLDEGNRVATGLATEAHKTRGAGVHDEVGTPAVRVERTPADECSADTTKLDAVSLNNVLDRMLLADPLGINAFSGGSTE